MTKFTPGPWWIAPPMFDGDVIYAPPQVEGRRNEVVATGITNRSDARLISIAPVMYQLLKEWVSVEGSDMLSFQKRLTQVILETLDMEETDDESKSTTD